MRNCIPLVEEKRVAQYVQKRAKRELYKLEKRCHYDQQGYVRGTEEVKKTMRYYALVSEARSPEVALENTFPSLIHRQTLRENPIQE